MIHITLLVILLSMSIDLQAQTATCNLNIEIEQTKDIGYRQRLGRCEGTYRRKTYGRINLRVIGYHDDILTDDLFEKPIIQLEVSTQYLKIKPLFKAESLRSTDLYQMDSRPDSVKPIMRWPRTVLNLIKPTIISRHVAVLACAFDCRGKGIELPNLYPIIFDVSSPLANDDEVRLYVMADIQLKQLRYSVVFDNQPDTEALSGTVGGSYIPAGRAVQIILANFKGKLGKLILSGTTHSGRPAVFEAYLNPPRFSNPE